MNAVRVRVTCLRMEKDGSRKAFARNVRHPESSGHSGAHKGRADVSPGGR